MCVCSFSIFKTMLLAPPKSSAEISLLMNWYELILGKKLAVILSNKVDIFVFLGFCDGHRHSFRVLAFF